VKGARGRSRGVVGFLLALGAAGAWLAWELRATPPGDSVPSRGANVLAGAPESPSLAPALDRLTWDDIAATAAGTGARVGLLHDVLESAQGNARPEVLYLRGLLLMAESRPGEALSSFDSIPLDRIPPVHLYAPFRLHGALRPGTPNPYREPLVAARRAGSLPPLIAARVAATEGDLEASLKGYLGSDPARWARHDLVAFRSLRLHAGLAPDTGAMIAAALRGGRVPSRLRADLERLVVSAEPASPAVLRERLRRLLEENPEAREVAVQAAKQELRARQLFLGRHYATLVAENRDRNPTHVPDVTLLLLLLSANRVGDGDLADRWAQEVRRRHPEPEVAQWLAALRTARS
jgi:hypothetical protein